MRWGCVICIALVSGAMEVAAQMPVQGVSGQSAAGVSTETSVYFSGQVTMEDGSAPSEPVLIQKICDGHVQDAAWTDPKGHFGFRVGEGSRNVSGDASEAPVDVEASKPIGYSTRNTNPVTSSLRNCQLRASLVGFASERVNMDIRDTLDNTNVGTLVLHPTSHASTFSISSTTLAAPPGAKHAYEKGQSDMAARKWDAADREFEKAVKEYPDFAGAWFQLGMARENQKDSAGAQEAWKESVKRDPKYIKPYEALATAAYEAGDWVALDQYSVGWLKLDPEDFPQAYLFDAFASAKLGRLNSAEDLARHGLLVDKQKRFVKLDYVLGVVLMQEGKYAESAKCLREYLALSPEAAESAAIKEQLPRLEAAAVTPAH